MIDTHTHLYDEQFSDDIDAVIDRAKSVGLSKAYLPNCDRETILPMMNLVDKFPDFCVPMMGIHPCYIKEDYESELAIALDYLEKGKFAAIGEIGLDFHWDLTFVDQQKIAFEQQIDWALAYHLPIVIHSRNATQECIDIVRAKQNGQLKGIFHCFGDELQMANQIIDLGFLMGIGGVVTFKKSGLDETLKHIDLKHLVLETDAPYLAPVPYRGKRNESSYLPLIANKITEVKGMALEEVVKVTNENALQLFA